jgi:hypothetical protein
MCQGDAAGPELRQHRHQSCSLLETHQASHAPDHSGSFITFAKYQHSHNDNASRFKIISCTWYQLPENSCFLFTSYHNGKILGLQRNAGPFAQLYRTVLRYGFPEPYRTGIYDIEEHTVHTLLLVNVLFSENH